MDSGAIRIARASNFLIFAAAVLMTLLSPTALLSDAPDQFKIYQLISLGAVFAVAVFRLWKMGVWVDRESVVIQNFWHAHRLPRYRTRVEVDGLEMHTGSVVWDAAHAIKGKPVVDIPRLNDDNRPKESLRIALFDSEEPEVKIRPTCILGTARGKLPKVAQELTDKIAATS